MINACSDACALVFVCADSLCFILCTFIFRFILLLCNVYFNDYHFTLSLFSLAPSAVVGIVLTPYPDSICVSWDPPNDNGGENITDYRISYRNVNTSSELMTVTTGPSTRSRLLNQLDKQTYYE